jgi:hypothetical protein
MTAPATSKRSRRTQTPREDGRRGLAPVAAAVARVTAPILAKRGLAEARIVTEWAAIAGEAVAERSAPERLVRARGARDGGGVLRLRVEGAWALEFQHMAPALLERINAYFGYPAVARLQLVQAPLPTRKTRAHPAPPPLSAEAEARLVARVGTIADPELRERLIALGRALEQRAARGAKPGRKSV